MASHELLCPICVRKSVYETGAGRRVCLSCGHELPRAAHAAVSAASFAVDEPRRAVAQLSAATRGEHVYGWVRSEGTSLPPEALDVLARCGNAAQFQFLYPIITLSTWKAVGPHGFSDGAYTLDVRVPVGEHHVDFVLRGPGLPRPLVIEITEPGASRPPGRSMAQGRERAIEEAGYAVRRIDAETAREEGTRLRVALMKRQMGAQHTFPGAPAATGRRRPRIWPRHEFAYDVSDRPYAERGALVESWLQSRGIAITPEQRDALALCDRAAEVYFLLPFLQHTRWALYPPHRIDLSPYWLTIHPRVDDYEVDFAIGVESTPGEPDLSLVEIRPPRHHGRDRQAEYQRERRWEEQGLDITVLHPEDARARGERWAASIAWAQQQDRAARLA